MSRRPIFSRDRPILGKSKLKQALCPGKSDLDQSDQYETTCTKIADHWVRGDKAELQAGSTTHVPVRPQSDALSEFCATSNITEICCAIFTYPERS